MKDIYLDKIMNIMDTINYGWIDVNNEVHKNTIFNIQKLYRLSTVEEILNNKIGICFDQVELERYFFDKDYKTSSYAIFTNHMIHSFLTLEKNNRYIYFEHSSYKNKGVYYFESIEELLEFAVKCFMNTHKIKNIERIKLVNYPPLRPMTTFKEITNILLNIEEKNIKRTNII